MDRTEAPFDLPAPGDLVANKYRIVRAIGRGGMGVVFAARHELLDQTVALKVLLPDIAAYPDAVSRFLNEARASARIRSEHVATVMDVGLLDGGMAYIVMELLEGTDLEALLLSHGVLSVEEIARCMLEALEGVAHAHALGIVHRDLKPSNLFRAVRPDGSVSIKVLDFGISKAQRPENDAAATATHAMLGSPLFMSPEQVRSAKTVDARSDLWSLGVIMYRLVTGQPPFTGGNLGEVLAAILTEPHAPIARLRPGVPDAFSKIVDRCLERDRDRRYANAAELAIALEPFAGAPTDSVARICRVLGVRPQGPGPRSLVSTQLAPEGVDLVGAHRATPAIGGSTVLASQTVGLPEAPQPVGAQAPREATPETMLGPSAGPWSGTGDGKDASSRRWLRMTAVGVVLVVAGAGALTLAMRGPSPSSTQASAPAPAPTGLAEPAVRVAPAAVLAPAPTSVAPAAVLAPAPTSSSAETPAPSASFAPAVSHPPSLAAVPPSFATAPPSLAAAPPVRSSPAAAPAPPRPRAAASAASAPVRPPAVDNILLQRN